jgi:hypothetical protein
MSDPKSQKSQPSQSAIRRRLRPNTTKRINTDAVVRNPVRLEFVGIDLDKAKDARIRRRARKIN